MLNKILNEILRINKIKTLDAFFNYSGHVDSVTVTVVKDGKYVEDEERKTIFDMYIYLDNTKALEEILKQLKGIKND